jgi:hypothetical protein
MRRYYIILIVTGFIVMVFNACKQDTPIVSPYDFYVSAPQTNYKVGDTVRFKIDGNTADYITFYSGEIGRRFVNASRVTQAGTNKLVFQTSMQQGVVPPAASLDSLKLLISTNLAGYDSVSIANATWVDITARNTKWPTSLATTYTTSDSVDISDFNTAQRVNIAFHYIGKSTAVAQRKYQIQNLTLSNNLPDGTNTPLFSAPFLGNTTISGSTIAPASSFAYTGWVECSFKNLANAWNVGTANISGTTTLNNSSGIAIRTSYPITFDPGTAIGTATNDDWLITSAVDLKTIKPDAGVYIQDKLTVVPLSGYNYVFKTPGTYVVTFVASNKSIAGSEQVIKQITINVQ